MPGKAYHCRILTAFVAHLTSEQIANTRNPSMHQKMRATCCWAMAMFCYLIDSMGYYLSSADIEKLRFYGRTFLITYGHMAATSVTAKKCLWGLKPQMHQYDHSLDELEVDKLNPKLYWCYPDEDFIGRLQRMATKVDRRQKSFAIDVMNRYMLQLGLHIKGQGQERPFRLKGKMRIFLQSCVCKARFFYINWLTHRPTHLHDNNHLLFDDARQSILYPS